VRGFREEGKKPAQDYGGRGGDSEKPWQPSKMGGGNRGKINVAKKTVVSNQEKRLKQGESSQS